MLDESGYTTMLQADRSAESGGQLENLAELARAMEEYETRGAFLEHVSLAMENDAARDEPKVTIMTIHAARGSNSAPSLSRVGRRAPCHRTGLRTKAAMPVSRRSAASLMSQ
jgi:hypothetical protein